MKGISDLLDSDMEDIENTIDENSILSSASDESEVAPSKKKAAQTKKPRKRRPVTMAKPKSRVTKPQTEGATKKPIKAATGAKRKALEEQVNIQTVAAEAIENESEDELESPKTTKPIPAAKTKGKKPQQVVEEEEMEVEQTPIIARSSYAQSKATKSAPKVVTNKVAAPKAKQSKTIPEIQVEQTMDVEIDRGEGTDTIQRPQQGGRIRNESRKPQEQAFRRRAGSASDAERGDPNLRRKLGDISRKFENIDLKYRNLKEVGINEANANLEKLRKQCETTTQASNDLIASLKRELAAQAPLAQDSRKLKKDMQAREAETVQLRSKVSEMTTSLADAQNEIKALQAKLSASRVAPAAEPSTSKTPGSAARNGPTRTVMAGSAEAIQATQAAQMKEDLYSDLTGLIIRSVKKTPEGDGFDCIQTGRNGTLHFKLFIDQEEAKSTSFEETEFLYTPLLDVSRDRDMIELMPDYLRDDITFARQNAAKFYSRVVDTLTKRRADEE